ncbi:cell envelope integrity protein TolA [uncultured Cohaesibacter sp.]|uniref:cell envelope integrity protein TolA n=1 Tax=uncultured Cohaesibacter sp. TaxID=1002546 RepID=UPI0029C6C126|nr:cell envelope integrity protein TolA [uncultured Cohaesibacter sp.]
MRKIGLMIFACLSLLAHITVAAVFLAPTNEVMEEAGQGETALEMGTLFDSTASKAVEPETLPERQEVSRTVSATEPRRAIPIKAFNQQDVAPRPVEPRQAEAEALPEELTATPEIQDTDIVKPREAKTASNSARAVPPATIREARVASPEEVTPTTATEIAPPQTIEAVDGALASMPRSRPPELVKSMEQQQEIERQKAREREAARKAQAKAQAKAQVQAQSASRAAKAARKGGATTNANGKKAATGGTGGKTKAANGDALTSNYKGKVRARLRRSLVYPRAAQQRRETGTATVRFSIAANGRATAISLVKSSGRTRLDRAALATVKRASPFPPLPSGTGRGAITMTVPIVFRM